jgi:hypothetical protein
MVFIAAAYWVLGRVEEGGKMGVILELVSIEETWGMGIL